MLNILKNTINRVFASGVDSDASAFITATGLSGTTQKSAITTLVKDLKSSGLWSKMKAVYPMVTDNRNLLSYSEAFDNAYWQKGSTTITTNTTTAPNGTNTADKVSETSATGYHFTTISDGAMINTNNYTLSFYAKSAERTWCSVYLYDGTSLYQTFFDLANGAVGTIGSGMTASIESVGNGWYRCSVSRNIIGALGANGGILTATGNNQSSFAGTTGSGIYIWGAQLELGNTATTYQPIATTPSAFMASQMKYNLKDARDLDAAFRLTWSGGWTYSATGATPNGTNAYADTKVNGLNNLTPTSTHFSYYSRTNVKNDAFLGLAAQQGTNNPGVQLYLRGVSYNDQIHAAIGESTGTTAYQNIIATNTNSASFFNIVRSSSTLETLYKGSTILGTNTTSFNANFSNANLYLGARNLSNAASNFDTRQIAFATIGNGLTDTDSFLLNQIVEKYQVALSRGVQAAQSFYYNSSYSNEANTYLYSTQITGTTQVSAINTLINGLKVNNLWSKMKAVYPFVTDKTLQSDMAAQMKFNLVNPQDSDAAFRLAFSGGWTYSTNGAQPNGTNGYADTKFIPSANLTINDQSYSVYSRSNTSAGAKRELGVGNIGEVSVVVRYTGDAFYPIIGNINYPSVSNTDAKGHYISNRTDGTNIKGYKNGNLVLNSAQTPSLVTAYGVYLGARNSIGVADQYSDRELAFATLGTGLTDAEALILYNLIQQYQSTLSRQV